MLPQAEVAREGAVPGSAPCACISQD